MHSRQWVTSLVVLLLASWASLAGAQETQAVGAGTLAPFSGVLLPDDAAKRLVLDLERYRSQAAELETLKAALAASERESGELRKVVAIADVMVMRVERAMETYDRALTKSTALMERQEKRIEQLESREKWMMILGPLGLLLGLISGAAL